MNHRFLAVILHTMPLLHLEALPPRTTKGEILHLLIGEGGIGRAHVGKIELRS